MFFQKDFSDNVTVKTVNFIKPDVTDLSVGDQDQETVCVPVDHDGVGVSGTERYHQIAVFEHKARILEVMAGGFVMCHFSDSWKYSFHGFTSSMQ